MGPNGSGKSTLTRSILGHPDYTVTGGSILFQGTDLAGLEPEERAVKGIFTGWQYPVEVPGVSNVEFLRLAANARSRAQGKTEEDPKAFRARLEDCAISLGADPAWLDRGVNAGFSGGQKKRNEILQMYVLDPALAILDETDSGLDIDALRSVAAGIERWRSPNRAVILITHYQRLLDLVRPDRVHILDSGVIRASGGMEIAEKLEQGGYEAIG
jgi:Fe-S cluster assembly ATP-binding protein